MSYKSSEKKNYTSQVASLIDAVLSEFSGIGRLLIIVMAIILWPLTLFVIGLALLGDIWTACVDAKKDINNQHVEKTSYPNIPSCFEDDSQNVKKECSLNIVNEFQFFLQNKLANNPNKRFSIGDVLDEYIDQNIQLLDMSKKEPDEVKRNRIKLTILDGTFNNLSKIDKNSREYAEMLRSSISMWDSLDVEMKEVIINSETGSSSKS